MKTFVTVLVLLLLSGSSFAQISAVVDTATAYRFMREGDSLINQKMYKQGCASYKQAIKWMPKDPVDPKITNCLFGICKFYTTTTDLDSLFLYAEYGYQVTLQLQAIGRPPTDDFYKYKATYYCLKGQLPEGIAWYQKRLSVRRQYFPNDIHQIADCYNDLGNTYVESGKLDSAMLMYDTMLKLLYTLPKDNPENQRSIAYCLQNKGILFKESDEYDAAISAYEQALTIANSLQDEAFTGRIFYNMGYAFELQGDLDRALDHFQKAGDIFSKVYGANNPLYAIALNRIATINTDLGNFEAAKELYLKSIGINLAKFGPAHPKIAIGKLNLSGLMFKMGQYEAAQQLCRESVDIFEKAYPAPHPLKVTAYNSLVINYNQTGVHRDSMLYYTEKSVSDAKSLYGAKSELSGEAWQSRCLALDDPKQPIKALEAIQESLIAASRQFNSRNIRQNPAPEDFFRAESGMAALTTKAALLVEFWQIEQQPERLELALQCLEDANALMQYFLRRVSGQTGPDFSTSEVFGTVCKSGVEFSTAYYNAYPNTENKARCFLWMERYKAQKLLLAAKNAHAKNFSGLPDSLLQHDAELAKQLTRLEKKLLDAEESGDSIAVFQIRNEQLFAAKNERSTFVKNLEQDYPEYFSLKYQVQTVDPSQVQALLSTDDMLLEIAFGQSPGDSLLFLYAITPTAQKLLKIPQQKGLADKITRLNSLLQNPALAQDSRRKEFSQLSTKLYQQFIQPIEDQLKGIKKISIIGEGITHLLPFEVLIPQNLNKPFQEMDFLVKHFEISYHYSATLWASSPKSKPQFKQDLLAFAPVFDGKNESNPVFNGTASTTRDTALRAFTADGNWTALPWTEKEVKNIAQLFESKGKGSVKLLMREQADEQNLMAGLEQGARCIHIASHSFANLQNPKFSGIACYPDKNARLDGTLYVGEIYNLAIPADLVVLSSCESGRGKLLRAEGVLGLNRAFLYAGAPNVLFTLWKINDRATADFFNYFYPAMLQGQSYPEALRSAKLKMLANPATALPVFWSGFLLIGK
jgi:CHAT domain-containing protein/tetratricopeptide (TPR) repeat protein